MAFCVPSRCGSTRSGDAGGGKRAMPSAPARPHPALSFPTGAKSMLQYLHESPSPCMSAGRAMGSSSSKPHFTAVAPSPKPEAPRELWNCLVVLGRDTLPATVAARQTLALSQMGSVYTCSSWLPLSLACMLVGERGEGSSRPSTIVICGKRIAASHLVASIVRRRSWFWSLFHFSTPYARARDSRSSANSKLSNGIVI